MANKTVSTIDLNTVDKDVMVRKLKISTRLANRIIALRPYQSVEQFVEILKIDPRIWRRIKSLVDVNWHEIIPDLKKEETPTSLKNATRPIRRKPKANPEKPGSSQILSVAPLAPLDTLPPSPYVKWFLYLIGLLVIIKTAFYAYSQVDLADTSFFVQHLCFFLAFIWLMINSRNVTLFLFRVKFDQIKIHPAWLFIIAALVLRFYALSIFPPANQTAFEEVQTGSAANSILVNRSLPIEFRFTNLLGVLGLSTGSEVSLSSLRFPFRISAAIGLILLTFSLQTLKISWPTTVLIVFIAATLRFLVVGSAVADELFASIPILTAFLLCMINSENTRTNRAFWLAAAGIFAGILMFEYTSYRMTVVVFGLWLFWKCVYQGKADEDHTGSSAWFNFLSFVIPLILVALPTLVQTIRQPDNSIFFEFFHRHGIERSSILSDRSWYQLKNQIFGLTGWPAELSAYYTPVGEPVVLPEVGRLFAISCLFGFFFTGRGIPRVLAVAVFLTVISASIFANDVNIGRMAPVFPILLLLSGIFLEKVYQKIVPLIPNNDLVEQKASSDPETIKVDMVEGQELAHTPSRHMAIDRKEASRFLVKTLASFLFLALISQITLAHLQSLKKMSEDPRVINEYINDDYSVCAYIGATIKPNQRVYIYSPGGFNLCSAVLTEGWYYDNKRPEILHIFGELKPDNLIPGDLVVMGVQNRALTSEEIAQLINLGVITNSLTSLQFSKNFAGRITVASICFQCNVP